MVEFFEDLMVRIVQPTIKKLSEPIHSWVTAGSQNSLILAASAFREGEPHQGLLGRSHQLDGHPAQSRHHHIMR
jgi:hypothetical protein